MRQQFLTITENAEIAKNTYRMRLAGGSLDEIGPGQFVNIRLDGKYLRRPISVCDAEDGILTLIYKVVGEGTAMMSAFLPGKPLDVLTGLGNGYDLSPAGERPLLIGGGAGVPPLYFLAKRLLEAGARPAVALGFNTASEVFMTSEFASLGLDTYLATADGSCGTKGFVTQILPSDYTYFYTCGPLPMLRAVDRAAVTSGQFSFEERMGCGFGACMGCTQKTKNGYKRVCKDGPVFLREEIIWED